MVLYGELQSYCEESRVLQGPYQSIEDKGLRQDCVHDDVELRDFASSHASDTLPGILAAHLGDLVTEAMVYPKFTGLLHLQPRGSIVGAAPRGHI